MSDTATLTATDRVKLLARRAQVRIKGKPQAQTALRQLSRWQWLPGEEIERLQSERLRRLLLHAARNVPYYREILTQHGVVDASGTVRLGAFSGLPLLDKTVLRERFDDLTSEDLDQRKWFCETSGGSTGEPARFIQDADYRRWGGAAKTLMGQWSGFQPGMPQVVLWGSERDLRSGKAAVRASVGRWLQNSTWLNAFRMTDAAMRDYVATINRLRPVQILAYVESIYDLARFIEAEGLRVHAPRSIMTAAGTLHEPMRETIERVFRAPVFNHYGSREANGIASECEAHRGLHVSALTYYFELLAPDGRPCGPGDSGEVVLTSLTNYAMPLIRYRISDVAEWAEGHCTCGRAWPLLRNVQGRVTDRFVRVDGSLVYGGYFRQLFYYRDWVRKFQIVQETPEHIRLRIAPTVAGEDPLSRHAKDVREIEDKAREMMGAGCRIEWSVEADIEPCASGKFRYTISNVPQRSA